MRPHPRWLSVRVQASVGEMSFTGAGTLVAIGSPLEEYTAIIGERGAVSSQPGTIWGPWLLLMGKVEHKSAVSWDSSAYVQRGLTKRGVSVSVSVAGQLHGLGSR